MTEQQLHAACVAEVRRMREHDNAKNAEERRRALETLRAKRGAKRWNVEDRTDRLAARREHNRAVPYSAKAAG